MSNVTQIAFQLDNETLAAVDLFSAGQSRAAVLRTAVHEYVARRREELVDEQLARGYADFPPGEEERGMTNASARGLVASDLDW